MKSKLVCLLVVTGALTSSVPASDPSEVGSSVTTIDALVADTVASNPELKFYEAEIAAADAGRKSRVARCM